MVDESTALAPREELPARHEAPLARFDGSFTREDIDLMKQTVCSELSDGELSFFLRVCQARRLNPLAGQIYAVKRRERDGGEKRMTIQTSVDGFRLIAERTGRYCPGRAATFAYDKNGHLVSATSYVKKLAGGEWHEVAETARYDEFCQVYQGKPQRMWATMPHVMLSKVAEVRALRRAFPEELMGLYSDDEMAQADNHGPRPVAERATKAIQSHETAQSYASATIEPETEETRRERVLEELRGNLTEATRLRCWDDERFDMVRFEDYDFRVPTEQIVTDNDALKVIIAIARKDEARQAAGDENACADCGNPVTPGQRQVSVKNYGRGLCPACQRQAKEAARAA